MMRVREVHGFGRLPEAVVDLAGRPLSLCVDADEAKITVMCGRIHEDQGDAEVRLRYRRHGADGPFVFHGYEYEAAG